MCHFKDIEKRGIYLQFCIAIGAKDPISDVIHLLCDSVSVCIILAA